MKEPETWSRSWNNATWAENPVFPSLHPVRGSADRSSKRATSVLPLTAVPPFDNQKAAGEEA